MEISYKPSFVRQFGGLEPALQKEVLEKIALFKNPSNHTALKVHKLHGKLKGCYSFSVNYVFRIVFMYETKHDIILLSIGDHDVYK